MTSTRPAQRSLPSSTGEGLETRRKGIMRTESLGYPMSGEGGRRQWPVRLAGLVRTLGRAAILVQCFSQEGRRI
jgi:hypothetical protein